MNENQERKFAGWYRPNQGRPWKKLVEADDPDECFGLLYSRCDDGEIRVVEAGKHPAGEKAVKRR